MTLVFRGSKESGSGNWGVRIIGCVWAGGGGCNTNGWPSPCHRFISLHPCNETLSSSSQQFFQYGVSRVFRVFWGFKEDGYDEQREDDSKIENGGYFILFHFFNVTTHERLTFVS